MTEHLDKLPFEDYCKTIFNKDALFDKPEALNGYRVLSCTQYILGPCAAAYLGELGAEVIKIEVPRLGEPMRHCSPYNETWFYPVSRWNPGRGTSPAFQGANHNEYFVTLDYRKPEAKEIFYNLVQKTDAMVWNYRPGTFDRWKIGYGACKEVNPRIVLAWCGGFGGFGPGRNWASYDILGQAKGGVFSFTGHRAGRASAGFPSKHTTWIMDYSIGMLVSTAMLGGLYWRDTVSGLGNYFECSQVQGSTRYTEYALPLWGRSGIVRMRWGNWDTEICVNGICACGLTSYPHSDHPAEKEEGYICVQAYTDEDFANLMNLIGRPDLGKKYATHDDRVEARAQEEIYPAIEEFLKDKTKEEANRIFSGAGIISQPLLTVLEAANCDHFLERGSLGWYDDPYYGDVFTQKVIYKMSESPPRLKHVHRPVGCDNEEIYQRVCGLSSDQIREMEAKEVI
jgi:crotonobetainyl-CoA:carnitine CoA-transferase CaiB-like acyl-CoA transferase